MKKILLSIGAIVLAVMNMTAKVTMTTKVFDKVIGDRFNDEEREHSLWELLLFIPCLFLIVIIPWYYIWKKCCKQICEDIDEIYADENKEWFGDD